jgi:hypothetical protein
VLDEAIEAGRRLLALDPAQEPVHRALMRLHVRAGRRTEALKQYQVCVDVLRKELGVEPERSTTRLHEQIAMRSDSPPAPGAPQARGGRAPVLSAAPAPLVGRQPELARLRRALDEAAHGRGSLVTVRGEAGIGKTRLIQELVASAAKQGARVVVGRCFESEQILPFGPWVEILRTEAVRPALDQVAVGDARRRTELARLLPELAPSSAAESSAVDNYLRIFDAVTAVIGALAAGPPTVLVLEDLHWADGMSTRLLAYVARRVRSWPLLLIASLRDEALPASPPARRLLTELDHEEAATPLPLALLAETETRDLVRRLAPARTAAGAVDRLSQQVWRLSDGHPFMVVETMRALQGGASPSTGERLPLAERIRQVIRERFERVGPRSRRLAEVAAVVGRECEVPLLRRAAGVSEAATRRSPIATRPWPPWPAYPSAATRSSRASTCASSSGSRFRPWRILAGWPPALPRRSGWRRFWVTRGVLAGRRCT